MFNRYTLRQQELFTGDISREYFSLIGKPSNQRKPVNDVRSQIFSATKQLTLLKQQILEAQSLDQLVGLRRSIKFFQEDFDYSFITDPSNPGRIINFEFIDGKNKVSATRPEKMSDKEFDHYCKLKLENSMMEGLSSASSELNNRVTPRFPDSFRRILVFGLSGGNIFKFIFMVYLLSANLMFPIVPVIQAIRYVRDRVNARQFNASVKDMTDIADNLNWQIKDLERDLKQSLQEEQAKDKSMAAEQSNEQEKDIDLDKPNPEENDETKSSPSMPSEEEIAAKREAAHDASRSTDKETAVSQNQLLESDIDFLKNEIIKEISLLQTAKLSFGLKDVSTTEQTTKTLLDLVAKTSGQDQDRTALLSEVKTQLLGMLSELKEERLHYEIGALSSGKTQLISPKERANVMLKEHEAIIKKAAGKEIPKLPAQNVNGNLYLGESQLVLLAHSAANGFDMPVYMNEEQLKRAGLEAIGEGVTLVSQKGNRLICQKVYNVQETNFVEKYPEVYAKIAQSVKEKGNQHRQAMKSKPDVRVEAIARLGVMAQNDRAATAAASLVAQAVSGQKAKAGGETILDGTFQDVVRWLLESGGLSSSEFYALSSASQRAMVTCIESGYSKEYGIDFNHEIESAVESIKEEERERESGLGLGEDDINESTDNAPGLDM